MKYYKTLQEIFNNKATTDIIIAQDLPNSSAKKYCIIDDYESLKNLCLSHEQTSFYEIITDNEPLSIFLDIESTASQPDLHSIIKYIKKNITNTFGNFSFKYYILDSSSSSKYSYHIIIRLFNELNIPFYFLNIHELKKFIFMDKSDYDSLFIDTSVYNVNRCFRMIHNTKSGKNSSLKCIGNITYGNVLVNNSNILDTLLLYKESSFQLLPEITITNTSSTNSNTSFNSINKLFHLDPSTNWCIEPIDNSYKVVPDCYTCLLTRKEHSDKKHSCLFINTDNKTIVKNCFSCTPSSIINNQKESKNIIQVINNVFNININFNQSDSLYNQLRKRLELYAKKHKVKREKNTGLVFKPITCYAFNFYKSAEDFINECFFDDEDFKSNHNNVKNLSTFVKEFDSSYFPFIIRDKNYIGFSNGLYNITTCEFIENYTDSDIVCNKYIDKPFVFSTDTPNLDIVLDYQFDNDVKRFIYTCLGRMFGIRDNWGFMLYLLGEAGCGKSLIIEILAECFVSVGSINDSFEKKYGLSYLYNKDIVVCDDLPKKIHEILPQQTFQSMITNGLVSSAAKNKDAIQIKWTIPLLFAGNWFPSYIDKGQISRRLLVANFEKNVYTQDTSLKQKILDNELPNFIYKCTLYYKELLQKNSNKSIWDICPDYFKEQQEELRIERNPLYKFLLENTCYEEDSKISLNDIKTHFSGWLGKSVSKLDNGTFGQVNSNYVIGTMNICKSCKNKHNKGCCESYQRLNVSKTKIVNNIKFVGM